MKPHREMQGFAHPQPALTLDAPSRRRFIRLVGSGAVVAAAGTFSGCSTELPDSAVQPWRDAQRETDTRRFMLAHALLAPNPHNRQPWIADLREAGSIHLICDGERLLPETDPFGRQILIGCGAFLELAVMAAAERGVAVDVWLFPDGAPAEQALPKGTRVATLRLGAPGSATADPLFAYIARRHTNKTTYASERPLPQSLLRRWHDTAQQFGLRSGVISDALKLSAVHAITREAYRIESITPSTWLESARLMRIGPKAIAANPDGITLNTAMVRALHTMGLFDPMDVPTPGHKSLERVMARWAPFETASGFLWLASPNNTRATQVATGRAHARCQLLATAAGVEMHPLSQALQEFPEMRGPRRAIHELLGLSGSGETLQMLSRAGFALQPRGPSPRRPLDALLRT